MMAQGKTATIWFLWLLVLFLWQCIATAAVETSFVAKPGCNERCGDVIVPYPFGIDKSDCAKNEAFLLKCNRTTNPPKLYLSNVFVYNISVENSTVTVGIDAASVCYDETGIAWESHQHITLLNTPLTFSNTRNKFTALGCDNLAFMDDADGGFGGGCFSFCGYNKSSSDDGSCSGFGCCQTPIPKQLKTLNMTIEKINNTSDYSGSGISCMYAFLTDPTLFNISKIDLHTILSGDQYPSPPVVLDWVVGKDKCEASEGPSGYPCGGPPGSTSCNYSDNGLGHRCLCMEGYFGNPYHPQGCQGDFINSSHSY
ncbi:wall-associated receptor kinase 2-like [Fagus crenata]